MNAFKKINKNGSITIPKEIRADAGLFPGNGVEIKTNDDGSIVINPSAPCCRFCGSPDKIIKVKNINICCECAKLVSAKANTDTSAEKGGAQ